MKLAPGNFLRSQATSSSACVCKHKRSKSAFDHMRSRGKWRNRRMRAVSNSRKTRLNTWGHDHADNRPLGSTHRSPVYAVSSEHVILQVYGKPSHGCGLKPLHHRTCRLWFSRDHRPTTNRQHQGHKVAKSAPPRTASPWKQDMRETCP